MSQQPPLKTPPKEMSPWTVYALVGEIGYLIAIPAIVFAFGGAYADKYFGTSPLFLLLGFSLAFASSIVAIRGLLRKVAAAQKDQDTSKTSTPVQMLPHKEDDDEQSGLI